MEDAVLAIKSFRLLGTWAIDCNKPIGPDNPRSRYFIGSHPETVVHTFALSEAGVNSNDLAVYSEIVSDDKLLMVFRKTGTPTTIVIVRRVAAGIQVIDALNSEGRHMIIGGTVVALNRPSQVFQRCGD